MALINTPVLILGGGIAGISSSLELSKKGISSIVIEKSQSLGGQIKKFSCKATKTCSFCGACKLDNLISKAIIEQKIILLTNASILKTKKYTNEWEISLSPTLILRDNKNSQIKNLSNKIKIKTKIIVIATGGIPFNPYNKIRFQYAQIPGIISTLDLEKLFLKNYKFNKDKITKNIGFIQCIGSRDKNINSLYCSRICCSYALRMAKLIKYKNPLYKVFFFYMDLQNCNWIKKNSTLKKDIEFIRGIPGTIHTGKKGSLVKFFSEKKGFQEKEFKLIILSQGLLPREDSITLKNIVKIEQNKDGFFKKNRKKQKNKIQTVYTVGSIHQPQNILESINHVTSSIAKITTNFVKLKKRESLVP